MAREPDDPREGFGLFVSGCIAEHGDRMFVRAGTGKPIRENHLGVVFVELVGAGEGFFDPKVISRQH